MKNSNIPNKKKLQQFNFSLIKTDHNIYYAQ